MVKLEFSDDGVPIVTQQDFPPTVYLDHWALRKFSADSALARRFTQTLEMRKGTLALSWLNLAEFSKVTDHSQGLKAQEFYTGNLPRLFFLDSDPFSVIQRENELLSGCAAVPIAPHADAEFLSTFAHLKPEAPTAFTVRELFSTVQGDQLGQMFDSLADTVAERIQNLRNEHNLRPEFQSAVARLPKGPSIQRGTRYILSELARTFLVNKTLKISRNHAIDFMHAVVPLAYCEFVLLDKHWEAQVRLVRSRLKQSGLSIPLAEVYSERESGVERFFQEFESEKI